jgi:hypothetical protein
VNIVANILLGWALLLSFFVLALCWRALLLGSDDEVRNEVEALWLESVE